VVVRDNISYDSGGGVESWQPTEIRGSLFIGNQARGTGGGGGVEVVDRLVATNSTFSFNEIGYGWDGECCGQGHGGGVGANDALITGSTIYANKAGDEGGGIEALTLELVNSTVADNEAGDSGGALRILERASIRSSTIVRNTANAAGGVNAYREALSNTRIRNSIVALNVDRFNVGTANCRPGVVSDGFNIEDKQSCSFFRSGDRPNVDPRLGPLSDNGGPTPTVPLLYGSPAIDVGDVTACPATDQRGVTRLSDGDGDGTPRCDIGAYEAATPPLPPPTTVICSPRPAVQVTSSRSDQTTLNAAIRASTGANSLANTISSITFGQIRNATVRVNGIGDVQSGQRIPMTAGTEAVSLTVLESAPGSFVPMTVTDACGNWPTFLGTGTGPRT
jgi:hypothetical protein